MTYFDDNPDYQHLPVIGLEDEYAPGYTDPPHSHRRAQLLYASSGVMSVTADRANFVVPPQRAVWIPSDVAHEVSCRGHVSLRTLYFDEEATDMAGRACRVVEISDFLKAMIVEMAHIGTDYSETGREARIIELLIDELKTMPNAPFQAPMPEDYRLLRVCREILANPADKRSLDDFAALAGMGRRTFTRLFKAEIGMGMAAWRQQVRLMEAISMLSTGQPVTTVAFEVGYESPSAFTAMFHRSFGMPPSHYLSRLRPQ
ncbi:MAG: helix-turn-helix transcriptional regulator [Sphingomonadales bacterium]|nr:helix-turn-helix transcriptional regulator [Sphingomonadales bacterium]